jgi:hypothetical protein
MRDRGENHGSVAKKDLHDSGALTVTVPDAAS